MKKIFSIVAVAATILLASCGGNSGEAKGGENGEAAQTEAASGETKTVEVTPNLSSTTGDLFQNLYATKEAFTLSATEKGEEVELEFSINLYSPAAAEIADLESCEAWVTFKKADDEWTVDPLKLAVVDEDKAKVVSLVKEGKGEDAKQEIKFKGSTSKANYADFEGSSDRNIAVIAKPKK